MSKARQWIAAKRRPRDPIIHRTDTNMCGIAGLIHRDGSPVETSAIRAMTDLVSHRGPDGAGTLIEGNIALGHRRLSILDLSDAGRQPMEHPGGQLAITYNGEIYNYVELRDELRALGHSFRTGTDTEVILAAYDAWGTDCFARFNGMWALAILDRRRGRVVCSRDRFGIKPFYYLHTERVFAFGSELRQLLPLMDRVTADREIVLKFLMTEAADLDERCFFDGVRKLPGGHTLTVDRQGGGLSIEPYYQLAPREDVQALSPEDAVDQFSALFEDAVRLRLRSDVPVGTCLSGGLDSSSVATIAAGLHPDDAAARFGAITAVSEQDSNNEAPFAEMVVNAAKLDWHQTRPDYDAFATALPAVVRCQEEPFGGPSILMQYFVMQTARANGITVLLDGQGGDETLMGYEKYYAAYVATAFRTGGPRAAIAALRAARAHNAKMGPVNMAKYLVAGLLAPARYAVYKHRHRYVSTKPPLPEHLTAFSKASLDVFQLQALEIRSTNLPVLLRYEDKNSMAHGIEARLPFLDYRLVEFALSLPGSLKIRDGWSKWVLRQAMDKRMPDDVVWRKNKFGFEAPEAMWLGRHLPEMRRTVLQSPLIAGMTDRTRLERIYDRLDMRSQWRLYSVALWENTFEVHA